MKPIIHYILLVLILFFGSIVTGHSTESKPQYWWKIEMTITVTGTYRWVQPDSTLTGNYKLRLLADASMELDAWDDFILYGGDCKIEENTWAEIPSSSMNDTLNPDNLSSALHPKLIMNYVIREKQGVCFDWEMMTAHTLAEPPLHWKKIILPRSALNKGIHPEDKYNNGIVKGTNKVEFPEKDVLTKDVAEQVFKWEWQGKKEDFVNNHGVSVVIKIVRNEIAQKPKL